MNVIYGVPMSYATQIVLGVWRMQVKKLCLHCFYSHRFRVCTMFHRTPISFDYEMILTTMRHIDPLFHGGLPSCPECSINRILRRGAPALSGVIVIALMRPSK